ncbi:MAG: hypothetical protein ACRC7N_14620 [Clostridium sp.]
MSEKKKLTIYINEEVLLNIKIQALKEKCSLSELTEALYRIKLNESKDINKK